jgi:hypothetical protein
LFTEFTYAKSVNDAVYYLYDNGKTTRICDGGIDLLCPRFQLGASFLGNDRFVVARNADENDFIEIYSYDGSKVTLQKEIKSQAVVDKSRMARPIVDINGKAILWHVGKYTSQTDYSTDGMLHVMY